MKASNQIGIHTFMTGYIKFQIIKQTESEKVKLFTKVH